jgi:hypothetical protein
MKTTRKPAGVARSRAARHRPEPGERGERRERPERIAPHRDRQAAGDERDQRRDDERPERQHGDVAAREGVLVAASRACAPQRERHQADRRSEEEELARGPLQRKGDDLVPVRRDLGARVDVAERHEAGLDQPLRLGAITTRNASAISHGPAVRSVRRATDRTA